ncbi:major capsid family protein [Entomobacter blattae]|uniref:DUF2184 domain-containing protein n=1 Tax=Entomobacter blattae TaxID=2762277 RepID=A0A7H1NR63_9PROT|nr:major capsid family protein [Entomobacter blattae]QNT78273.1 hypothetical protein JGUZn3_10450 [Entomobacter blattae]
MQPDDTFQPSTWAKDGPILAKHMGVVLDQITHYTTEPAALALDSQPALNTVPNLGVPLSLLSTIDPQLIRVLNSPLRAEAIYGRRQMGAWSDKTLYLKVLEGAGYGVAYGDFNKGGMASVNTGFEEIDRFLYQTHIRWGELEEATIGTAQISLANELRIQGVNVLERFINKVYFYGIAGQRTYGVLNAPQLLPAIQPDTKKEGGTAWDNATNIEIYNDVLKLFDTLVDRLDGVIDMNTPLTLVVPNSRQVLLRRTNDYSKPVTALLQDALPNIRIEVAPELGGQKEGTSGGVTGTGPAGNMIQLFVDEIDGTRTVECAFPMRLRLHRLQMHASSLSQKMSIGTWGAIIRRPVGIAQMIGV